MNQTCRDGLIIPALATSPRNAMLYLAGLLYCFLGIAIAADVFMCAIERITSATRKVKKNPPNNPLIGDNPRDDEPYEEVRVWNPTVANLTLMALGSSAPEILLSIIEIVGNGFKSGDLGPGTIVGSAAFNLFFISAICVIAVSSPGVKKIEAFKVFVVTTFFGTFAYLWLLVILQFISPDVVEVWEAALTLVFFFVLVVVAYAADVELWKSRKPNLEDELEIHEIKKAKSQDELDVSIKKYASQMSLQPDGMKVVGPLPPPSGDDLRHLTRDVARAYPQLSIEDQAKILAYRLNQHTPKDRLWYRIRAIRGMSSSWKRSTEDQEMEALLKTGGITEIDGRRKPRIEFSARVYAIEPQDRFCVLTIIRRGPSNGNVIVNFQTVNGIAKRDLHYLAKSESIRFGPGERQRDIQIQLVEGADWRPNHVFYVHLKIEEQDDGDKTKLGICSVARVRYPDDTASLMAEPSMEFVKSNYVVSESNGWARLFVTRRGKVRKGRCTVTYETNDVTAQASYDYVPVTSGKLVFDGNEYEKYIDIEIIDDKQDEKDETFTVELLTTTNNGICLGGKRRATVTIISDDNVLKNITNVRKLMGHYLNQMTPGQNSWKEQIKNASSVNAGDTANATVMDCILHALAFPWKFAMAFVPPPNILGGWLSFVVALAVIGLITAIVGDLASIFGCMVGLKDAVTAITLVALGTSLPDTFASKIAAQNDDTADNAVGNVTGSNSVNVFLGLGLPWLVAALYWASKGESFEVKAGDLGFSVTVFMLFSLVFLVVLLLRRTLAPFGKAELGGPAFTKFASGLFFVLLWVGYVSLSIWNTYRA